MSDLSLALVGSAGRHVAHRCCCVHYTSYDFFLRYSRSFGTWTTWTTWTTWITWMHDPCIKTTWPGQNCSWIKTVMYPWITWETSIKIFSYKHGLRNNFQVSLMWGVGARLCLSVDIQKSVPLLPDKKPFHHYRISRYSVPPKCSSIFGRGALGTIWPQEQWTSDWLCAVHVYKNSP